MLAAGDFIYLESNIKALYINIKTDPYKIAEITKPTGENTNNLFYYGGFHYLIKNYGNIKVYRFADKYEDELNKDELLEEFYKMKGITSNTGLDNITLSTITGDFIIFLISKGFKRLKTQSIFFCD